MDAAPFPQAHPLVDVFNAAPNSSMEFAQGLLHIEGLEDNRAHVLIAKHNAS